MHNKAPVATYGCLIAGKCDNKRISTSPDQERVTYTSRSPLLGHNMYKKKECPVVWKRSKTIWGGPG
jgi:hypothetical protein